MAEISPREQRSGMARLMIWGCAIGILLLIAVSLWPLMPAPETGAASKASPRPNEQSAATDQRSNQGSGASTVGATQSGALEDSTGAKARAIQHTASSSSISGEQRDRLRDTLTRAGALRVDSVDYTLSVGGAVPRQAELRPLPPEASTIMQGYSGAEYVVVRDQLVIVDPQARRIVAIIPGVG